MLKAVPIQAIWNMPNSHPTFETRDRKQLYEFIESHESVRYEELLESDLLTDPARYRQLIAVMKRDGLLEETDGILRAAVEPGKEDTHELDGLIVTVRPARQEDISGIIGVIRQVTSEKRYVVAETVEQQLSGDSTIVRTDLTDRRFFVATVEGEVVGWCGLEIPELDKLRHTAELTLGVLEEYRDKGIGGYLLDRGLQWAETEGLRKVYNSIPAANEGALEFLGEHGWQTEAIRNDHYKIDNDFVDEVMMAKSFR